MSTSSQKHSNLLAAKSALGLSDDPKSITSASTSIAKTSAATSTSASASASASSRISSTTSVHSKESKSSIHSARLAGLHDLSSTARAEARRGPDDVPPRSSFGTTRGAERASFPSEEGRGAVESSARSSIPRSAAGGGGVQSVHSASTTASNANPLTSSFRDGSVASSDVYYLEEGSRDDSMAALAYSGGRTRTSLRHEREDLQSSSDLVSSSNFGMSSSNFGMSSSNFGMSSANNFYEKKVSFNNQRKGRDQMLPLQEDFDDGNFSAKKVSFNTVQSGGETVRAAERSGRSPVSSFHSSNASEGGRNEPVQSPRSEFDDFGESDTFRDSGTFHESNTSSQFERSDEFDHSSDFTASHQSLVSEGTFAPQRFDEMRSLLLNITPLQLEALVAEIFSNNNSTSGSHLSINSGGNNSRAIPPEWKGIRKKAKRFNFRKDAYLGEMSFDELANFAESISLWAVVDNDRCSSYEEAMDIFAIEFERLVSGHPNENSTVNSVAEEGPGRLEDDLLSYVSANSQDADEGENLRRSLRACSVPELRLVAERLNLDHTVCGNNKTDLIALIESSMPDMLNDSFSDVNSQQRPPPRGYLANSQHSNESNGNAAMYVEESYAQQQQQEQDDRHKRVKFSTDCKQDTSHLIPKREVNQAVWGNYVVNDDPNGEDIESAQPLVLYDNGGGNGRKRRPMKWPEQRRRFITVGVFVSIVVGIALGLGLGLTREQSEGGASSSTSYVSSPWDVNYGIFLEKTEQPSASPSKVPQSKGGNEVVVLDSTSKKSSKPTQKPTFEPAASMSAEPYVSGGMSSNEIMTNSPTEIALADFIDSEDEDFGTVSTIVPGAENSTDVAATLGDQNSTDSALDAESQNATEVADTEPNANSTEELDTSILTTAPPNTTTTIQPIASSTTTESLYPMLGPFDEAGMRMILHGVTELSSMGQTQWKMLTSAFIEQFYNHGEKGDDAIQNIVFDVTADIEIDDNEMLGDGSLIITFTTAISYHTFSAFLEAETVVDRPFSEEEMRSSYIEYLEANNAKSFIGDVTSVTPIFRGEEIPSEYLTDADTNQEASTTPTAPAPTETSAPSASVGSPMPSSLVLMETAAPSSTDILSSSSRESPAPSPLVTSEPSIKVVSLLTPRPTLSESSALTPRPTQNSFSSSTTETVLNTFSPVGGGGSDAATPFPTSNAFDSPSDGTSSPTPNTTQIATNSMVYTDSPTPEPSDIATNSAIYTESPTTEPSKMPSPKPVRRERTASPTKRPTTAPPTNSPTSNPTPSPTTMPALCDLSPGENCRDLTEVMWEGSLEVGQTHIVKAVGELRRAPRVIAHREAELLFSPAESRRLDAIDESDTMRAKNIEAVGTVYIREGAGNPLHNKRADALLDGSDARFVPNTPDVDIIIDLKHVRLIEQVSVVVPDQVTIENVQFGLRYDDGQNTEEQGGMFFFPQNGWLWHDIGENDGSKITLSIPKRKARYVTIHLRGGRSTSSSDWSLQRVEIIGYLDGLSDPSVQKISPMTRAIIPNTTSRIFTPPKTAAVRVAVYSRIGTLLGVIKGRDPSMQRAIFESQVSETDIDNYSDTIWSATIPFNWVEEGNIIVIGCVDSSRPSEVLVHRLQLKDLAQFSEHSITRTKMAIFGTDEDVAKLNTKTFDARKLVRNLHAVIPSATLKFADTDLWHLPYLVVLDKEGKPALVNSEEKRRAVTGVGTEIGWEVMKNFLTIRHALAQAGLGLAMTMEDGNNSPYASHTSVFMGWSLSKHEDGESWEWEDLGYWDTLAAAAWTGWVAMKAGDECSNYFIHELGHAQSMQHFDHGAAASWGIEKEYPNDGVYTSNLPWGYDSVARQFRTWFDPLDGSGKKDPLNGEGEPPYSQELNCFSQYTPYQAQISQEWAMSTPILLSASTSDVPRDGAYQFNTERRQYIPLTGPELRDSVGENAMMPDQVSVPIITLIGTIGASRDVCQTYPALRGYGNTFELPDPFEPGLPSAFQGASYFVEVRLESGRKVRALIAVKDVSELSLYSFNIAIDQRPVAVDLYRFVDGSYPDLSAATETQLLHIRPIELPPGNPLQDMPRQLSVGRGWLGDSSTPLLNAFCISPVECESDKHNIEWRGNVGSDNVMYISTLEGRNDESMKATVFQVPALREDDSKQYKITVLAARFFNDGQGMSPLLTTDPITGDGSSSLDVTHMIRIWAPWDMNDSLPVGFYRSVPNTFTISADVMASSSADFHHSIIELKVDLFIGTVTAPPTSAPTKRPSDGPTPSPVPVRYHIDWKHGTCVTEGPSTEWAPPYETKEECCKEHMTYEYNLCMNRAG